MMTSAKNRDKINSSSKVTKRWKRTIEVLWFLHVMTIDFAICKEGKEGMPCYEMFCSYKHCEFSKEFQGDKDL